MSQIAGRQPPPQPAAIRAGEVGRRGSQAALQLAIRSALQGVLSFAGTILLARLLAPADFGVYAIVGLVIAVWGALGDFGLGASIVQQPTEPTKAQLATVWTFQQCIALTTVAIIWLAAPIVPVLAPGLHPDAEWMVRALSIGLVFSSLRTLPAVVMERELRFGPLALSEMLQQSTFYLVAITLAVGGAGAWSFILGGLSQLAVGALVVNLAWRHRPSIRIERAGLRSMFGFGLAYQTSAVIATLRDAPLPAIAGTVTGTVGAGMVQFAMRVATTMASLDAMIARIAFPAFARLQHQPGQERKALDTAILLSGLLLVPAQCWLSAMAPLLVPIVFGNQWNDAIVPLQIICLGTLLRFPARYLRQAEFARGATRQALGMSTATAVLTLGCFSLGLAFGGLPGSAAGFLVGSLLGLITSIELAGRDSGVSWSRYWWMLISGLGAGLGTWLVFWLSLRLLGQAGPSAASVETAALAGAAATAVFVALCSSLLWLTNEPALRLGWRLALKSVAQRRGGPEAPVGG